MFIHTRDRYAIAAAPMSAPSLPRHRRLYPLRIAARIFVVLGITAFIYAVVLVGLFFQSAIIVF